MNKVLRIQQKLAKKYPQALSLDLFVDPLSMDANELSRYMAEVRADYEGERAYWNRGGAKMARVVEREFCLDSHDYRCRLYYPQACKSQAPGIIYIHGGGYIVGSNNTHDRIMRDLADLTKAVVIGVEYSLSPEARLPIALYQCIESVLWVVDHGEDYGIDGAQLALAGDSCGATLVMGTLARLHEMGRDGLVQGVLLYYGGYGLENHGTRVGNSTTHSESSTNALDQPKGSALDGMRDEDLELYRKLALPMNTQGELDTDSAEFEHMLAVDFRRVSFPPACIVAAGQDPLLADSVALAAKYQEAGMLHEYHCYTGVLHAFLHYSSVLPEAQNALHKGADFLKGLWR